MGRSIVKKFIILIIRMFPAVYFADIIFFEDCAECTSENTDLKKDQVQPEEKNNPQSDSSTKNESEEKEEEISAIVKSFVLFVNIVGFIVLSVCNVFKEE